MLDIVIIGADPAGLATARLLHRYGIATTVLERDGDRAARTQGGSLDLGADSGLCTIDAAGLRTEFDRLARPHGQRTNYFDADGTLLLATDESDVDEFRPEIDRLALRVLLLDSLPEGTVRWGARATSVEKIGMRWRIGVADSSSIEADLVIGADGIKSAARGAVTDEPPAYSGATFAAGEITHPRPDSYAAELAGEGAGLVIGRDKGLLCQRNGDGSIRVYCAQRRPFDPTRGIGATCTRAELDREFRDFAPALRGLLDEVDGGFVWWPLYAVPAIQHWRPRSGLTLIGDAAHVMPPFSGQGVNMGLADALSLVTALTTNPDVDTAIAQYEAEMLPRMADAIAATRAAQDMLLSPDGPAALLALATTTTKA